MRCAASSTKIWKRSEGKGRSILSIRYHQDSRTQCNQQRRSIFYQRYSSESDITFVISPQLTIVIIRIIEYIFILHCQDQLIYCRCLNSARLTTTHQTDHYSGQGLYLAFCWFIIDPGSVVSSLVAPTATCPAPVRHTLGNQANTVPHRYTGPKIDTVAAFHPFARPKKVRG